MPARTKRASSRGTRARHDPGPHTLERLRLVLGCRRHRGGAGHGPGERALLRVPAGRRHRHRGMREAAMLEDFRDHDPNPTVHERAWMETNPYPVIFRLALLGAVATIVGLSASSGDPL